MSRDTRVTRVTRSQQKKREKMLSDKSEEGIRPCEDKPEINQVSNKFFKRKTLCAGPQKRSMLKSVPQRATRLIKIRNNDSSGEFLPSVKQPTLSASFAQASLCDRLRPRKDVIDHCDASLSAKSISPDESKSIILLENIDSEIGSHKAPVYKSLKITDKDYKGKESVYEFDFVVNDPQETVTRKVKKKINNVEKTDSHKGTKKAPVLKSVKATDKDSEGKENVCGLDLNVNNPEEIVNKEVKSPTLRILTGDRKVSFKPSLSKTGQNSTKFNPFRSTLSVCRPRPTLNTQEMLNHSLLNKSLSPIKNETDHFDPASPWRPPTTNDLFSVKQVVQSTPQPRRITSVSSDLELRRVRRILEDDKNMENVQPTTSVTSPASRQGKIKAVKSMGVRTSNAVNIQAGTNISRYPPRLVGTRLLAQSSNRTVNKANTGFGDRLYKSPIKNDKVMGASGLRRKNQKVRYVAHDDENLPPREDVKLIKQSKVNTFPNIDEMPESLTINTSCGVFGDSVATPAIGEQTLKMPRPTETEICFGFDDDYSSNRVTPVKFENKQDRNPVKNALERLRGRVLSVEKDPSIKNARISLGEIKNTLYLKKETMIENVELRDDKKRKKELEETAIKDSRNQKADVRPTDASNTLKLTDTFDVLSESAQGQETHKSLDAEISLLADTEPVHFTKPPRRSYEKKRKRTRYWSSEEEEDDDDESEDHVENPTHKRKKRQKLSNIEQVENKKIEEWVKSVNDTFREIDEFDLVVEKAP